MPLLKPTKEDQAKLHAEINQLSNQRLAISTTAISVICVVLTWLAPKGMVDQTKSINNFVYFTTAFLFILLVMLFWLSYNLKKNLRVISSYLVVSNASNWEVDWLNYLKKHPTTMYTTSQTFIFFVLGSIVFAYPYVYAKCFGLQNNIGLGKNIHIIAFLIYLVSILLLSIFSNNRIGKKYIKRWSNLLNES